MRTNHTPGPWKLTVNSRGERLRIVGLSGETVVAGCGCCGSPFMDNAKGDAPLINAAPDLLAVAIMAFYAEVGPVTARGVESNGWKWGDNAPKTVSGRAEALRAAIAKAQGEGL